MKKLVSFLLGVSEEEVPNSSELILGMSAFAGTALLLTVLPMLIMR